jgi:hypothetical protein
MMYDDRMTDTPERPGLHRVTVNLVPKASSALADAARITGDTQTDTINRALQVYLWAVQIQAAGKTLAVIDLDGSISGAVLI